MTPLFTPVALSPDLSVHAQITPELVAQIKAAGFASVINNRPDFEHGADQSTSAEIEAAAQAHGLPYRYLPVSGAAQTAEQIAAFAQLLSEMPKPILAFCRSGGRCTRLFQQAQELGDAST